MKTISLTCFLFVLAIIAASAQGKIKVFNTSVNVQDIIGTTNLTTQKWSKDLPKVLVKNEEYYLKIIGSYRDSYNDTDPNYLFNLIDKGNYPLLDEINVKSYDELALPELKGDPSVKNRSDFISFCKDWEQTAAKDRKALLFKNEYTEIAKIIQGKRFQFTTAPYKLKQDVTKKFDANVTADIKANLKANNIDASASLVNYLSNKVTSQTEYAGIMLIVEFEDNYMTRLKNTLNGLDKSKLGTDDFSLGLKDYAAPGSISAATTGLVVFKLDGKINKSRLTEESLKADIKSKFKALSESQVADITAAISIGFVSKVERLFSADIDNVYIKSLLTSKKVDDIELDKAIKALVSQN